MDQRNELSNKLTLAMNDFIENIQDTFKKLARREGEHLHVVVNELLEVWLDFTRRVIAEPAQLAHNQLIYWQDYLLLCKDLNKRLTSANEVKARLADDTNKDTILHNFIEKFSFLISQHMQLVIKQLFTNNGVQDSQKILFFTRQFLEAFTQHQYLQPFSAILYAKLRISKETMD